MNKESMVVGFFISFLLFATTNLAQNYSLAYEAAGLDTWDTSTVVLADYSGGSPTLTNDQTNSTTLPWVFEFFGRTYSTIYISSNNFLVFVDVGPGGEGFITEANFRSYKMIAPLWFDGQSIVYKNEYSDRVVFTWDGQVISNVQSVRVQAVLYRTGDIRLRYGVVGDTSGLSVIAGISAGDNTYYLHNDWGYNSQTAYYRYLGLPAAATPTVAPSRIAPTFSNFNATPSTIKRSQTVSFNISILDDTGTDPNTAILEIVSPQGTKYGPTERPKQLSGDRKNGVYYANWTVPRNATNGEYSVYAWACDYDRNCPTQYLKVGNFIVNGTLIIDTVVKAKYNQTDEIVLSGKLKDVFNSFISNASLTLTIQSSVKYIVQNKTDSNGNFYIKQRTTLLDPLGNWTLSLKAEDMDGNEGELKYNFTLLPPLATLYYNVIFLSPTDITYFRGETVRVSVKLLDLEKPVGNANVSLKLPSGEIFGMSEVSPGVGIYQTTYRIKYGDSTGSWNIGVEALKQTDTGLYGGSKNISINVRPVDLIIDILSPTDTRFTVGEKIKISANVKYPDNTPASGMIVNATPVSKSIMLYEKKSGIYENDYKFTSGDIGRYSLRIFATDAFDNLGFYERTIFVIQPTLFDFAVQYWYLTLSIFLFIAYFVVRLSLPQIMLQRYEIELQRQQKLKQDTQNKYFVEGNIDEETFNQITNKAEEKILELKGNIKELKKRLEKRELKIGAIQAWLTEMKSKLFQIKKMKFKEMQLWLTKIKSKSLTVTPHQNKKIKLKSKREKVNVIIKKKAKSKSSETVKILASLIKGSKK